MSTLVNLLDTLQEQVAALDQNAAKQAKLLKAQYAGNCQLKETISKLQIVIAKDDSDSDDAASLEQQRALEQQVAQALEAQSRFMQVIFLTV